ncbi:MAG: hypothetical protein R3A51_22410 [Nannocystaceae bacterium]
MPRPARRDHQTPRLGLALGLALGCTTRAAEPTPRQEVTPAPRAPVQEATLEEHPEAPVHPVIPAELRAGVVGHVLFGSLSRSVERARHQLAPPALAWALSEDTVRKALRSQSRYLRLQGGVAPTDAMIAHADLIRPIGCGLVDPAVLPGAGACAFGYSGGATRFLEDMAGLAPRAQPVAPAGHLATYLIDGEHVLYVDALPDAVVVSMHTETFARLEGFLTALTREPRQLRDLEVVAYPGPFYERYMAFGGELLTAVADGAQSGVQARAALEARWIADFGSLYWAARQSDPETIEALLGGVESASAGEARQLARLAGEASGLLSRFDHVGLGANLERAGLVLSAFYEVRAGELGPALAAAPRVEKRNLEAMPAAPIWLGASSGGWLTADERSADKDGFSSVLATMLALAYESETGQPRSVIEPELEWFVRARDGARGGRSAWALYGDDEGPGAVLLVREDRDDAPDRAAWRAWTERFTPERILGPKLARHITWEFQPDAIAVEGVPVDRWTLRFVAEADDDPGGLFPDELRAWFIDHLGREVHVDRAQHDGRTLFVIAPQGPERTLKAALAAARGEARMIDAGVPVITARSAHATGATGFNARSTRDWLLSLLPEGERVPLPEELGADLSDIYQIDSLHARGGASELIVSQPFLDQLRAVFGELVKLSAPIE